MPSSTLVIRPSSAADLPAITAVYAWNVAQVTGTFELESPDLAEMGRRRDDVLSKGLPWLVAERDGQVLGYAYAGPFRPRPGYRYTVEESVYVAPDAKGKDATTYNFTNVGTGSTATDTGLIVIVAMGEDNAATFGVNNVVVNGVTFAKVVDEDGTGVVDAALWRGPIEMQGGTLAAVDVTFSEALAGSATVCAWLLKNLQTLTPTSSIQDDDTASGALVLTTGTTTSGGYVVGGCITQDTGVTTAWAVLTEREDADNGEHDYSNADAAATGASMANTCDWSGTGDASGVAAAFR